MAAPPWAETEGVERRWSSGECYSEDESHTRFLEDIEPLPGVVFVLPHPSCALDHCYAEVER